MKVRKTLTGFKGIEIRGTKTWKATEKEKRIMEILIKCILILVPLAILLWVIPTITFGLKILVTISAGLSLIGLIGCLLFFVIRHNREDLVEFHAYDEIDF